MIPIKKYSIWKPTGWYSIKIVGTSYYREEIYSIAKNPNGTTAFGSCIARLVLEKENPRDPNAVRVEINGTKVGYLERTFASEYRSCLALNSITEFEISIFAMITGGIRTEEKIYDYSIELDFPNTLSMTLLSEAPESIIAISYGYAMPVQQEDGSYQARIWLPSANLEEFDKKLRINSWTNEDWDSVNFYIANKKRAGLGFKIYEIEKNIFLNLFGKNNVDASITLGNDRFATMILKSNG